jgi:hypothetical protein
VLAVSPRQAVRHEFAYRVDVVRHAKRRPWPVVTIGAYETMRSSIRSSPLNTCKHTLYSVSISGSYSHNRDRTGDARNRVVGVGRP